MVRAAEPKIVEDTQSKLTDVNNTPKTQYQKVMDTLNQYNTAKMEYETLNHKREYKEASLRIYTDWKVALPEISRPTLDDKASYIKIQMKDCYTELMELKNKMQYLKECYEVEKTMLKIMLDDKKED